MTQARAQQAVELELALLVDCSSSVNSQEFELQMRGIAAAFRDEEVIAAIRAAGPRGIAVSLIQWAGAQDQAMAVEWTVMKDEAGAEAFARAVDMSQRYIIRGATSIAEAMVAGGLEIENNDYEGARRVLDVSGDGRNNDGTLVADARDHLTARGFQINGLAILNEDPETDSFYRREVIGGPGSFVIKALDYADFAHAIRQKLIREIAGGALSALE